MQKNLSGETRISSNVISKNFPYYCPLCISRTGCCCQYICVYCFKDMIKYHNHEKCPYCTKEPLVLVPVQRNEKIKKYCEDSNIEEALSEKNESKYCCFGDKTSNSCIECIIS